jgi:NAD(P)-dependent dehydrogenase (short-subunit alcohol dehydrogenase family)
MDPRPDHGETSYKGSGRLPGRKALITGGDSGMGRAAAIAYAREGADVAISYYPTEEPDAREVIELIKAEGRKAIPMPGDLREEKYCRTWSRKAVAALGGLDIVVSMPAGSSRTKTSSTYNRSLRRDDEDQHLRAFLDHQGRAAASQARLLHHRDHLGAGLRSRQRICTTTRRPRPRP